MSVIKGYNLVTGEDRVWIKWHEENGIAEMLDTNMDTSEKKVNQNG